MIRGRSIRFICAIGATVALATMLGTTTVRADGQCFKGYRDTTAAERETMTNILEAAVQALPPAPQGWVANDDSDSVPTSVCQDVELIPWSYHHTRSYQRVDSVDERNAMLDAANADLTADLKAKQPRIDAIMARNQQLAVAAMDAAGKGDYGRVDAINEEIDAGVQEVQRIYDEGPAPQRVQAATTEAIRDLSMEITIAINPNHESPGYEAQEFDAPAGTQVAFRWSESDETVKDDNALVLLGKWKPASEDSFDLLPRANVAAWAAHGISISVKADENRLTSITDAIDWNVLATMLPE